MTWIKSNKTKLYRLIAEYMYLPKMKDTNFTEMNNRSSYCLEWYTRNGTHYRACYMFANNSPRLLIQYKEKLSESFVNHMIRTLEINDLVNRGMIKGIRSEHQIRHKLLLQQESYNALAGGFETHSQILNYAHGAEAT